jgi:hypothetical protein
VNVAGGATTISLTHAVDITSNNTDTITAQIVSAPSTSVNAVLSFSAGTLPLGSATYTDSSKTDQNTAANAGVARATGTIQGTSTSTTTNVVLKLTADVAGSYQILVTADAGSAAGYSAGKLSTNYTITTTGAPTSLSVSTVGAAVGNDTNEGAIVKLTMKDANGNATVLGQNESLSISHSLTNSTSGTTLGATSFGPLGDTKGVYSVTVIGKAATADGTDVVTFTGSGLLPSTLTTNASVSAIAASDGSAINPGTTSGVTSFLLTSGTGYASATGQSPTTATKSSHSITYTRSTTISDTDDTVYPVAVVATGGDTYATTITIPAGKKTGEVSVSAALAKTVYTAVAITFGGTANTNATAKVTVSYASAGASTITVASLNTSVLSATAGTNSWTIKVADQFAAGIANIPVTVAVSGRNTVATTTIGVTDAKGYISYSLKDAGTTGTTDSVVFSMVDSASATKTATATVTYGSVTVATVAVTGGSTVADAGVAGANTTAISAADNGPEASAKEITATVKDASGNLLAGVPVTFSVSSGLIVKSAAVDYTTVYTNSAGKAVTKVFNWVPGTQTITATAGGKSGTDYLTWAATDASSARVLSITATGNVVSVKVVDRFGNGVKGVTASLSRTGTGFFGNGTSTATVTTDKSGTADIQFNGNATITAELNTTTYAQSADVAGEIAATAVTAAVAGTTTGTGASLAPAGVYKASVDVSDTSADAVDAANEATDAANAATDAANAAAEAADAATAAAQDAQAAVAALATSVASLIAGIKAQITTLTNLVIKIQKKVKA